MQEIILKNSKIKLDNYCILCTDKKKLSKNIYKILVETIFLNTENTKTNESNKFIYEFTDKLSLKNPNNKNIGLINLGIYYTLKNIKSVYNNNKLKISPQLGTMDFNCLMVLVQSKTFKITLKLS